VVVVARQSTQRLILRVLLTTLPLCSLVWGSDDVERSPAPPSSPLSGQSTVTFIGFHVFDDGSSRIYVKLTSSVPVDVRSGNKTLQVHLSGARLGVPNNGNPLLTQHFSSPVVSARAETLKGVGVVLHVELREQVKVTHRTREHGDGSATLHLDFPTATSDAHG
jgi:hypothetical protein